MVAGVFLVLVPARWRATGLRIRRNLLGRTKAPDLAAERLRGMALGGLFVVVGACSVIAGATC
jgi:hypothetical protein